MTHTWKKSLREKLLVSELMIIIPTPPPFDDGRTNM